MTKILVAEDEEVIRDLYQACLSDEYNSEDLQFVETGDEAISELEKMLSKGEKPDLVITDNKMPGTKTGMDVIDYVIAKFPGTPVIMVASENLEGNVEQTALEKGASAYLSKPISELKFLKTVEKYAKNPN